MVFALLFPIGLDCNEVKSLEEHSCRPITNSQLERIT